jgi:hypothetical protein
MKINLIFALFFIYVNSCNPKEAIPTKPDAKIEIAKWKRQLLLNGEIGTPCDSTNPEGWAKKNPEVFYGFPDSINSKVFDINRDKINDILLYFPAGDCCTCSIGMNEKSDFVKLIYSDGTDYLTNENLRTKIEQKIENQFFEQTNTDVLRVVFTITDFNGEISGTYQLWTLEDPDCCAGYLGTFKYNPFTWKIEIGEMKVLN